MESKLFHCAYLNMADPIDKPRQSRVKRPTAKLTDVNNLQQPALSFQRAAVEAERARLQLEEATAHPSPVLPPSSPPATSSRATSPVVIERLSEPPLDPVPARSKRPIILSDDEDDEVSESRRRTNGNPKTKGNGECYTGLNSQILTNLVIIASTTVPVGGKRPAPSDDEGNEEPESQKRRKDDSKGKGEYRSSSSLSTSTDMLTVAAMDEDGMYRDVTVLDIGDEAETKRKVDPTADIKHFFGEPFSLEGHGKKKRRLCKTCQYVTLNCSSFLLSHQS